MRCHSGKPRGLATARSQLWCNVVTCISYRRLTPVVVSSDTPSIAFAMSVHLLGLPAKPCDMRNLLVSAVLPNSILSHTFFGSTGRLKAHATRTQTCTQATLRFGITTAKLETMTDALHDGVRTCAVVGTAYNNSRCDVFSRHWPVMLKCWRDNWM